MRAEEASEIMTRKEKSDEALSSLTVTLQEQKNQSGLHSTSGSGKRHPRPPTACSRVCESFIGSPARCVTFLQYKPNPGLQTNPEKCSAASLKGNSPSAEYVGTRLKQKRMTLFKKRVSTVRRTVIFRGSDSCWGFSWKIRSQPDSDIAAMEANAALCLDALQL